MADPGALSYYGDVASDALFHSPVHGSYRMSQAFLEQHYGDFGRESDKLSPAEATQLYGMGGELKFDEPVYESYAKLVQDRNLAEIGREYELSAGREGHVGR